MTRIWLSCDQKRRIHGYCDDVSAIPRGGVVVATEEPGVWRKKLKVCGIYAIVGVVILIVVEYVLWRLGSNSVNTSQHLIDAAIISVALSAVGVSIWQGLIARKHAKLSVKPWLEFVWKDKKNQPASGNLTLANNGLGPAIVTEVRVAINDGSLDILTPEVAQEIWRNLECKPSTCVTISLDGAALRAGEEFPLLTGLPPLKKKSKLQRVSATAKFVSMYGELAPEILTTFEFPE
jgi:hypothetical protein